MLEGAKEISEGALLLVVANSFRGCPGLHILSPGPAEAGGAHFDVVDYASPAEAHLRGPSQPGM